MWTGMVLALTNRARLPPLRLTFHESVSRVPHFNPCNPQPYTLPVSDMRRNVSACYTVCTLWLRCLPGSIRRDCRGGQCLDLRYNLISCSVEEALNARTHPSVQRLAAPADVSGHSYAIGHA